MGMGDEEQHCLSVSGGEFLLGSLHATVAVHAGLSVC